MRMAQLAWIIGLGGMVAVADGEMIYQGTTELGVSAFLDQDTVDDALLEVDVTFGQFVYDYWEVGAMAGVATSDSLTRLRGGVFTEYNIELNRSVLPFVGLNITVIGIDADFEDSDLTGEDSALGLGGAIGLKGFLHENVALTTALNFDWASSDVFLEGDSTSDTDLQLRLGLRYYF